ncbi:hypothetical protein J6590_098215 [Homalodisca vitripennis]|nr:hypothetical protein J6590_098215 [Homalodisca vitripennis]
MTKVTRARISLSVVKHLTVSVLSTNIYPHPEVTWIAGVESVTSSDLRYCTKVKRR